MQRQACLFGVIALVAASATAQLTATAPGSPQDPANDRQKICQMVVNHELGATPYKLCLTHAEWDAKKLADAKDANRIVCHYQEDPGTRFRSAKVCMPQSAWDEQRRSDRESVDDMQRRTCVYGAGC